MQRAPERLWVLIEPIVEGMGYELVGVAYSGGPRGGLLRVYIDHPTGIGVDDCERVSHQVSGVLDVEDPIATKYSLEVSSPGLDRPLFRRGDYERFAERPVKLRLATPIGGRRNFSGVLRGLRNGNVLIDEEGTEHLLPLEQIEQAHLVPVL